MRYDPLLCHYLARELHERLAGAPARALRLAPAARVAALETDAGTLVLELHPTRGLITLGAPPPAETVLPLHRRTVVGAVRAPADERLLVVELPGGPHTRIRRVVVELLGNQWNLLALDGDGRIVAVLWPRDAGDRRLRARSLYSAPAPSTRLGMEAPLAREEFVALLAPLPPQERAETLVARVAWTSPINAGAIVGADGLADGRRVANERGGAETLAGADRRGGANELGGAETLAGGDARNSLDTLAGAYERYLALAARPPARPCVLRGARRAQPYPLPLPGAEAVPAASLLEALALALGAARPLSGAGPGAGASGHVPPELLERLRWRAATLERRARRLEAQALGALDEAIALRARGDVLLANLHALRKGEARVVLPGFEGGEVEIELDPALSPTDNARRLYEEARRREHAAERVPALVAQVEAERALLLDALARAETGELAADEVERLLPSAPAAAVSGEEERLPYRRYRSSGGFELRVGRSRRDNDQLTFHHSAPNDIWLHARDVGGAHVILRWADTEANPPHRDLVEAAVLAALHSKARTSGLVPVDWTRRKYVRKPRKAPPGLVVPERVKTLFVEPDEGVEKRLRA